MKAALLVQHHQPLSLCDIEPQPLAYGQVLVKIVASGICGAQLQEIDNHKVSGPLPHPLGHEGCAIVQEVGIGVRCVKPGDKVVAHWRKGDGIECDFPKYTFGETIITGGKVTTFSEFSVCSENRLTVVPKETPDELCALLGCGLSTALGTIEHEANLKMGESVLIVGCGGLGMNLILAAKMRMASFITVREKSIHKGEAAYALGANAFWAQDEYMKGEFDVVIDTTGNADAIGRALSFLAPSGRFIMVGQPRVGIPIQIENARHLFNGEGCSIKATQGGCFNPDRDIPRYIRLHEAGLLRLDGIVSHHLPLSDINEGIELVRNGHAGRVMIIP